MISARRLLSLIEKTRKSKVLILLSFFSIFGAFSVAVAFSKGGGGCGYGADGYGYGCLAPVDVYGKMTGGGSIMSGDEKLASHGFILQCRSGQGPDNLEVNWGKGNRFHLDALAGGKGAGPCFNDLSIVPDPPQAGFDTILGTGYGELNGEPGAWAMWRFSDGGEPGGGDFASIKIIDSNGNVVLDVSGLVKGNHQAHGHPSLP